MSFTHEPSSVVKKVFLYRNGKIFFSRSTERRFYFIATMGLAVLTILYKTGLL